MADIQASQWLQLDADSKRRAPQLEAERRRKEVPTDDRPSRQNDGPGDGVLQLADVSRPGVFLEHVHGVLRDPADILVQISADPLEEMTRQQRNPVSDSIIEDLNPCHAFGSAIPEKDFRCLIHE